MNLLGGIETREVDVAGDEVNSELHAPGKVAVGSRHRQRGGVSQSRLTPDRCKRAPTHTTPARCASATGIEQLVEAVLRRGVAVQSGATFLASTRLQRSGPQCASPHSGVSRSRLRAARIDAVNDCRIVDSERCDLLENLGKFATRQSAPIIASNFPRLHGRRVSGRLDRKSTHRRRLVRRSGIGQVFDHMPGSMRMDCNFP